MKLNSSYLCVEICCLQNSQLKNYVKNYVNIWVKSITLACLRLLRTLIMQNNHNPQMMKDWAWHAEVCIWVPRVHYVSDDSTFSYMKGKTECIDLLISNPLVNGSHHLFPNPMNYLSGECVLICHGSQFARGMELPKPFSPCSWHGLGRKPPVTKKRMLVYGRGVVSSLSLWLDCRIDLRV